MLIELEVCKGADTLKAHLQVDHTPVQLCAYRQQRRSVHIVIQCLLLYYCDVECCSPELVGK